MAEQDKPADAIPRVVAQQDAESIAHEERKRHHEVQRRKLARMYGLDDDDE